MTGRKKADKTSNSNTKETWTSSDCSGQYSYLIHFQISLFTKVVLTICLVTEMIDWKQKLMNQWFRIEISHVQPGNFLRLGSFPFQYNSVITFTRRYGQLRGPTSSSCSGLWPLAWAFFMHFYAFFSSCGYFCVQ